MFDDVKKKTTLISIYQYEENTDIGVVETAPTDQDYIEVVRVILTTDEISQIGDRWYHLDSMFIFQIDVHDGNCLIGNLEGKNEIHIIYQVTQKQVLSMTAILP